MAGSRQGPCDGCAAPWTPGDGCGSSLAWVSPASPSHLWPVASVSVNRGTLQSSEHRGPGSSPWVSPGLLCETDALPQRPAQDSPPSSAARDSARTYCERALSRARSRGAQPRCTQRRKRQDLLLATAWGGVRRRKSSGRVGLGWKDKGAQQGPAEGHMAGPLPGVCLRCLVRVPGPFQRGGRIGEPGAR